MEEESRKSFAQITLYNQLIKEMDDLYRVYAKNCNLSETAFWILYCIREREKEAFTQREICDYWFYTPQTVNSALKNMTEEGLLILRTEEDNRKNKRIYLTEKGERDCGEDRGSADGCGAPGIGGDRRAGGRNIPENYEKTYGIFPRRNRGTDKTRGSRVIAGTSDDDTKTMPA